MKRAPSAGSPWPARRALTKARREPRTCSMSSCSSDLSSMSCMVLRLYGGALHPHAQGVEQPVVVVAARVGSSQELFARENAVGPCEETKGLQLIAHLGAASAEADATLGKENSRRGDHPHQLQGGQG